MTARAAHVLVGLSVLVCLLATATAGADLHLVKQFTITGPGDRILLQQPRDLYLNGQRLALKAERHWILIHGDRQVAWFMDADRKAAAAASLADVRRALAVPLKPDAIAPRFTPSSATRTVAGLRCRVYRARTPHLEVETCVTRELPDLEGFQALFGQAPDVPGVPLDLTITATGPQGDRMTVRETVEQVSTKALDPSIFAEPAQGPAVQPQSGRR